MTTTGATPAWLEPVERQLDRFNEHDVEGFIACYTPDARLDTLTGEPMAVGHSQMREVYSNMFAKAPDLRVTLINTMIRGNFVVYHEVGSGDPSRGPGGQFESIVAYRVVDGLIDQVWFVR